MSFTSFLSDRQRPAAGPTQAQTASDLFGSTTFQAGAQSSSPSSSFSSGSQPSGSNPIAPTASDLFSTQFDPARLHPLAGISEQLDFLQLDEDKLQNTPGAAAALPSRGWTDELCYGTGTTYLSGLALGGVYGLREGLARPLGEHSTGKLRLNSVLNSMTRRGTFFGNSLGVLALFYNAVNSSVDAFRGEHDIYGAVAAGAISGAIYKSTAGLKPALVGAGLMAAASGAWNYGKRVL